MAERDARAARRRMSPRTTGSLRPNLSRGTWPDCCGRWRRRFAGRASDAGRRGGDPAHGRAHWRGGRRYRRGAARPARRVRAAAAAALLDGLAESSGRGRCRRPEFPFFLAELMRDVAVQRPAGDDPRVHIWGALEARLQSVDRDGAGRPRRGRVADGDAHRSVAVAGDAHRIGPAAAGAAHRPVGARFRRGDGGEARDRRPRREARRRADGRIALAATIEGRGRRSRDRGDDGARTPLRRHTRAGSTCPPARSRNRSSGRRPSRRSSCGRASCRSPRSRR